LGETRQASLFLPQAQTRHHVTSEYVGGADLGRIIALLDDTERSEGKATRAKRRAEMEAERTIDHQLDEVARRIRLLTATVLLANGYHHHKGQWRKRRDVRSDEVHVISGDPRLPTKEDIAGLIGFWKPLWMTSQA